MAPLVRDLPCCRAQPQPAPRRTDLPAIEGVSPSPRLLVHANEVMADSTPWILALAEACQLWMMTIANRPSRQHGLGQQSLAPQSHQAAPVQVLWMQRPQSHQIRGRCPRPLASGAFVLVVPELRLPELDLVFVRVHDPRKLAVLVRFGSLDDFHTART